MKKVLSLGLLLLLILTGCAGCSAVETPPAAGQEADAPPETEPPVPEEGADIPAAGEDAADPPAEEEQPVEPARSPRAELKVMLEGMEESFPVELYTGSGWSLYIPREDWVYAPPPQSDTPRWHSSLNPLVTMEVRSLEAGTLEEAREAVRQSIEADWVEDRRGGLFCETAIGLLLEARFFTRTDGGTLVLLYQYPEEAAEGFGVRLGVIADTFQVDT